MTSWREIVGIYSRKRKSGCNICNVMRIFCKWSHFGAICCGYKFVWFTQFKWLNSIVYAPNFLHLIEPIYNCHIKRRYAPCTVWYITKYKFNHISIQHRLILICVHFVVSCFVTLNHMTIFHFISFLNPIHSVCVRKMVVLISQWIFWRQTESRFQQLCCSAKYVVCGIVNDRIWIAINAWLPHLQECK